MEYFVLALPVIAASILASFFAALAAKRRSAPGALPFVVIMGGIAWWTFAYTLELMVPGLGPKVWIAKLEYLGIAIVAPAWLALALEYRAKRAGLSRTVLGFLAAAPAVTLAFVWTNDLHQVFWTSSALVATGPFEFLKNDWGPVFWLHIAVSYGFWAAGMGIFALEVRGHGGVYRRQALTLLGAAVFPWVANLLVVSGIMSVYVDLTPFAFLIAALACYNALFAHRLFDLLPVARDKMFDELAEGVMVVDTQDRVVDANASLLDIIGKPSRQVLGKRLESLGFDLPAMGHNLEDMWLSGISVYHAMERRELIFDMTSVALGSPPEGYRGRLIVLQDVTERTLAQQELQESNRRLEEQVANRTQDLREANVQLATALNELARTQRQIVRQERLSALGQMASGIAHEFNNSLSPIVGFSQILLGRNDLLPEGSEERLYLQYILTAAKDGAAIVSNLREFYRLREQSKIEPVDLDELTDFIVRMTRPRWREQPRSKGVEIKVLRKVDGHPTVMGEASSLREVLTNLVFNAVDAMPEGGTITIMAYARGSDAIVEVRDTGTGMTDEVVARCFDPFYSTKGEAGTGLGLALVQSIVDRHGGRIEIETELGRGSAFLLTFPLAQDAVKDGAAPAEVTPGPPLRILAIDDDRAVLAVVEALVRAEGHSVDTFDNPVAAVRRVHQQRYDVVITDLAMPAMSGDQVTAAVKAASPGTAVVLVTGFADVMGADNQELAQSADYVLSKPISAEKLRSALLQIAGQRQMA